MRATVGEMKVKVMDITGITPEGQLVVAGVYEMFETHGVPLVIIFCSLKDHDMYPDWVDFYRKASRAGISHSSIVARLREATLDPFGPECLKAVMKLMEEIRVLLDGGASWAIDS